MFTQILNFITTLLTSFPWSKLFTTGFLLAFYFSVSRKNPENKNIRVFLVIIPIIILRDLLFFAFDRAFIILVSEALIISIYYYWMRSYTGKKPIDFVFYGANAAFVIVLLADLVVRLASGGASFILPDSINFLPRLLLIGDILWISIILFSVTEFNTANPDILLKTRLNILRIPLVLYGLGIFINFNHPFMSVIVFPFAYLLHFAMLLKYDSLFEDERKKRMSYVEGDLEALFEFMQNVGNAIAEKIEINQVLKYIVSSAVKSTNADAGAVLLVDEFDDILSVKAVEGVFPPPYTVPEVVKVQIQRIQTYFESTPIKIGDTILGEVVKSGEPIYIRSTATDARMKQNTKNDILFISSIMVIPLIVSHKILGVLATLKRKTGTFFSENDFSHLKTFADYASLTIDNILTYMELLEKKEMEREVGIAADIQQKLLPRKLPRLRNIMLSAYSIPAKGVSGDYYDVIPMKRGRIALVMCDVAGKGVPASLVMVMIRSILHLITSADKDAATTMNWINRGISGQIDIDHFATMSFINYDPHNGELEYSNAAHHPLMIYRSVDKTLDSIDTEGLPIGIEKSTRYGQIKTRLVKDDIIIMYTDGIIEAMNVQGEQYGFEALSKVVMTQCALNPDDLLAKIREDIEHFVGNAKQHDDMTILCMKID